MLSAFRQVATNLYRGPRPISPVEVRLLRSQYGIVEVINLQGHVIEAAQIAEEAEWCAALEMPLRRFPLDLVRPPAAITVGAVLAEIDRVNAPVYVHCHDGVDRTGVVCAAYRMRHGMTFGQAVGEMIDDGFHLSWYALWLPVLQKELAA